MAKLRKVATQKKKEHANIMNKVAVLEESRGKLADRLREARKVVEGLDSDSETQKGSKWIHANTGTRRRWTSWGTAAKGRYWQEQPLQNWGRTFLDKTYGDDLHGPARARGTREGRFRYGPIV